jgi:hypothetical protein
MINKVLKQERQFVFLLMGLSLGDPIRQKLHYSLCITKPAYSIFDFLSSLHLSPPKFYFENVQHIHKKLINIPFLSLVEELVLRYVFLSEGQRDPFPPLGHV